MRAFCGEAHARHAPRTPLDPRRDGLFALRGPRIGTRVTDARRGDRPRQDPALFRETAAGARDVRSPAGRGDEPRASLVREIRPHPREEHRDAVPKSDQVEDVDEEFVVG